MIDHDELEAIEARAGMADQDFVARAREDVPRLCAEVRALRKALERIGLIARLELYAGGHSSHPFSADDVLAIVTVALGKGEGS